MGAAAMGDVAALADGSLDPARKQEVLDRVRRSPELEATLDEQREAIGLLAQASEVRAPDALHTRLEQLVDRRSRWHWLGRSRARTGESPARPSRGRGWLAGAGAVALAAGAVLAIALVVTGGSAAPTLGEYVALGSKPPTSAAPHKVPGHSLLSVHVEGVPFPYWEDRFGWSASGARSDTIAGHAVTTVFYRDHAGERVAYSIVAGTPPRMTRIASRANGGQASWQGGVPYWTQDVGGKTTVVWMRAGHRCILSARGLSPQQLIELASWTGMHSLA
jgi:hypothetical protein